MCFNDFGTSLVCESFFFYTGMIFWCRTGMPGMAGMAGMPGMPPGMMGMLGSMGRGVRYKIYLHHSGDVIVLIHDTTLSNYK